MQPPTANSRARLMTPMESRPVICVKAATRRGPITAANLPKMSKKPKYSEIGPGNGLDAALHGAHQKGHAPEENQGKLQRLLAAWILFNVEAHKKAH